MSFENLVGEVVTAVRGAGERVEEVRRTGLAVRSKGAEGPVTAADHAANRFLRERLPDILSAPWLSEETADSAERLGARRVWIVDPIDGTKELVAGRPEYAVSVALVEEGRPVLGVVLVPPTDVAWWAVRGGGAFREGERVHVREGGPLLASRTELAAGEFDPLAEAWTIEPMGGIAHKLALVASGDGGLTLSRGPKSEWDVCAGALLVEEAGGVCTDIVGRPLRFNQASPKLAGILGGAPRCHRRALSQLESLEPVPRMQAWRRSAVFPSS